MFSHVVPYGFIGCCYLKSPAIAGLFYSGTND